MPLKPIILERAKKLELQVDDILDIVTETMLDITFDKVYSKKLKSIRYFINGLEVSGFKISLEGKNRKDLFIAISKTL